MEHSIDGRSFHSIGSVIGDGNLLEEKAFDFLHENPLHGINYYRLKQIDFYGGYEYSNVANVSMISDRRLQVYPNPTSDFITITTQGSQRVRILNGLGELIISADIPETLEIDIQNFLPGVYYINMGNGESEKFIKI